MSVATLKPIPATHDDLKGIHLQDVRNGNVPIMTEAEPVKTDAYEPLIDRLDPNYAAEVANIPVDLSKAPKGADHEAMRKWGEQHRAKMPRDPKSTRFRPEVTVKYTDHDIQYGEGGRYTIRVHEPLVPQAEGLATMPAVIFYHGGGWIHGNLDGDHPICDFFASELRAVVFNVDYRLAPEHPFPAPLDDCFNALDWAIENAKKYNVDTNRIALWGCSAGGNLAAGVTLRDAAEHQPSRLRHVHLVVPVTCHPSLYPPPLDSKLSSLPEEEQGFIQEYVKLWGMYVPEKSYVSSPYASPLLVSSIPAHHPSAFVTVAARDFLRDEGIAYAQRLRSAGIDTQLEIVPGVPHNLTMAPSADVAKQFFRDQVRAFNAALNTRW